MPTVPQKSKLTNNQRAMQLYEKHGLTRPQIAALARVTRGAVDRWLRPPDSQHFREMPDGPLELLELKLGEVRLKRFRKKNGKH